MNIGIPTEPDHLANRSTTMNEIEEWISRAQEVTYWPLIAAGVAVLLLALMIIRSRVRKARSTAVTLTAEAARERQEKSDQRRLTLIFTMALAINADAMFRALTEKAQLAWWFALPVFAFFEVLQLFFMHRGTRKYKETGRVGNAGLIVWLIAFASSSITLLNSHNAVEMAIRVALPCIVAIVWMLSMETEVEAEEDTQYRWSRDRVLVALRIKEPKQGIDYGKISRESKIKKIVALRYHMDRGGRLEKFREWRLDRLLLKADKVDLVEARARLIAVRLTRKDLGLPDGFSSVPDVPDLAYPPGTQSAPGQVGTAGTSGTREQVSGSGISGMNPIGSRVPGMEDESGTDTDPDQVRAWAIIRYMNDNGLTSFPAILKLREICAAPGRRMSSQDVAIRARDAALVIMSQQQAPAHSEVDSAEAD